MIRTYLTIAIKYLIKQSSYSILSILGFSLAFASVFFIYSHVSYQKDEVIGRGPPVVFRVGRNQPACQ